jgi:hypothetical protein
VEGSGRDLIEILPRNLLEENHERPVGIADVRAEIRTKPLSDKSHFNLFDNPNLYFDRWPSSG